MRRWGGEGRKKFLFLLGGVLWSETSFLNRAAYTLCDGNKLLRFFKCAKDQALPFLQLFLHQRAQPNVQTMAG
jgi:hypothetical protein